MTTWAVSPRRWPVAETPVREPMSEMDIGLAMQAQALKEGHRKRLPTFATWAPPEGEPTARARILKALSREWKTSREVADATGIVHRTASMTLADLRKVGKVEAIKRSKGYLWRLPDAAKKGRAA